MQNIDILKQQVNQHQVIFFDVYDTLIKRTVPEDKDVFQLVEMFYNKKFNTDCHFSLKRIAAEREAREKCKYREVNLDEIYNFLDTSPEDAKILKSMELEAESAVSTANEALYQIFQYCLKQHKKIYIVSDTYLHAEQIDKILHENGYNGYFRIYSSCDVRLTKWEHGDLYKKIISEEKLKKAAILHIGNDKVADYKKAKQQGIDAFLISSKKYYGRYYQPSFHNFDYQCMELFVGSKQLSQRNPFYRLGFEVFGPLIYGFTQWLIQQCNILHLKKLFFFSRDGYLLKKAFDLMHSIDAKSDYFYTSRKAIIIPLLQFDSSCQETLQHYKSWDKNFSWKYLFERYNVPEGIYKPILESLHVNENEKLNRENLLKDAKINEALKMARPFFVDNASKQLKFLRDYMLEKNFAGSVGVIDMGAGCSIEFAFNELLTKISSSNSVKPYYLYLHTSQNENLHRKRYLDSGSTNPQVNLLLRFCYMFLEIILAAPHGTVSGYAYKDSHVVPILEENEYNIPFADTTEKQVIDWLQQGALDFVEQFHQTFGKYFELNEDVALAGFKKFGITPLADDILFWQDFKVLLDGYVKLIRDDYPHSYILHPQSFLQDVMSSVWPSGFFLKHFPNRNVMRFLYMIYSIVKRMK